MAGLARYLSLRSGFYDFFQVGAGLHIVAAVTESCVTGLKDCVEVKGRVESLDGNEMLRVVFHHSLAETWRKR